ncbi:Two-component response regulator, YesN/AraC family, consists of REC and AraC-type DNA-binding domains [Paenibacillus sp. UNCCL117]|uniref:response regulator n=1 Tax=unclassified Paenibacillus TaxID=185978 RepID=UPI00088C56A3|nr:MULTISPECIES: response regulator [unclassified Paenibacillus]SDD07282.1 Two-component response regulator, YesN/AraC family, consists of REC and AraC-type DNA-binding domains [Paenibacillus sp. cl123]SFW31510.1 Two-component response regulator, YesN/AraC family, consists of REC and AraC-type DNA-binding domains [Paenibacillus sp. UNCCL117]
MKIIVVEDETDILRGLLEVIEWSGLPFKEVLAAQSAEEALELIGWHRPEIILTDILLPEMTGLDMLEEVKALHYEPKVVVISSYSNFMYAQRSLQLGAVDYMLKPASRQELAEKIGAVYEMLHGERVHREQLRNQTEYARLGTEALKEKFVLGLCLQQTALQEHIHHRLQMWNLQWLEKQSYVLIALSIGRDDVRGHQDKDLSLDLFAIGNIAEELLKEYQPAVMVRSIHHDWVILTAWEQEQAMAQHIHERIRQFQKLHASLGISERMHAFQAISEAYEQARKALKLAALGHHGVVGYAGIAERTGQEPGGLVSGRVAEAVLEGDMDAAGGYLEQTVQRFMLDKDVSRKGDLAIKCFEWMLEVHACLSEKIQADLSQFPMELWEKADSCQTAEEVKRLLLEHLQELIKLADDRPSSVPSHFMIDKVKRIMHERYEQQITLQSVAEELSIHPVWLSRLFKKETGQNFLDYLTEVRIGRAKHMLRHTNLKIYEIAEKIGYQELQYFGRLFKKRTNMTPKEFRYGK